LYHQRCAPCYFRLPFRVYWAESLHAATYLLNLLPTKGHLSLLPHFALFGTTPSYAHLRVFGCACYPNTSATTPYKLAPRYCWCVFLGYFSEHKGYRCLDLSTNCRLVSWHVVFDESSFPFASSDTPPDDLDSLFSSSHAVRPIAPPYPSSIAGTLEPRVAPTSRFIEPSLMYQRRHPAPVPEPSRAGLSVYHPIVVACDPRSTHRW
jgi:hypothetical protein